MRTDFCLLQSRLSLLFFHCLYSAQISLPDLLVYTAFQFSSMSLTVTGNWCSLRFYFAHRAHSESPPCRVNPFHLPWDESSLRWNTYTSWKITRPCIPRISLCNHQVAALSDKMGSLMGTRNLREREKYIWPKNITKKFICLREVGGWPFSGWWTFCLSEPRPESGGESKSLLYFATCHVLAVLLTEHIRLGSFSFHPTSASPQLVEFPSVLWNTVSSYP